MISGSRPARWCAWKAVVPAVPAPCDAAFIHIVLSGLARRVLVVGFEHAASHLAGDDVRLLYGLSFDADMEGIAGVTATALYALSINLHMQRSRNHQQNRWPMYR